MDTLYILVPVHNRIETTRRFIECLERQTYRRYHLVLIDDGSTDRTAEMVQEKIAASTILRGDGSWWWGGSLHQGYLWLKSQNLQTSADVLIINDDAIFDSEYLQTGVDLLRQHVRSLLVSTAFGEKSHDFIDGGVEVDWKRLTFTLQKNPGKANCASTRGLFLRMLDFFEIGGFYPRLLPHYGSDYEFTIRAHRKGFNLIVDQRLRLYSNEQTTGYHDFESKDTYARYMKRLFSKKSTQNPWYLTNFIALACPWPWKPLNWTRIWLSTVWKIAKNFVLLALIPRGTSKT